MPAAKEIPVGARFGRLVVEGRSGSIRVGRYAKSIVAWRCHCDCGVVRIISGASLRRGNSQSCGCARLSAVTKHGQYRSRAYSSWQHMIERCHNSHCHAYPRYGGRGVTIYARWRNSFTAFLADMGERPPHASIDRIDNAGNYEPGNVRWASDVEQNRNRRPWPYMRDLDDKRLTIKSVARILAIEPETLKHLLSAAL